MASNPGKITVTLSQMAKLIDHSLLQPFFTDAEIDAGLELSKKYDVATACIKPYSVAAAKRALAGTTVGICAVVGFPHGNSTTAIKAMEAAEAVKAGATEIDMVVNVGKVLSGDWAWVEDDIKAVNHATVAHGGILKVIFENDFLKDEHIIRLCEVCTKLEVAFVKTSTGYGFTKQANGDYNYRGATIPHLKLMKKHAGGNVKVKAAGGVRTLDDFLYVISLGIERVGLSATAAIMEEAKKRGISETPTEVEVRSLDDKQSGGY
jgi:deoxyribose-phosphate aldolase